MLPETGGFESIKRTCGLEAAGPRLHLNMIVKDEGSILDRALFSVAPHIESWTIVDTGSSDNTLDVAHNSLRQLPGKSFQRPWVNFAHNRNEAMELAHTYFDFDYLLTIDADEFLEMPKFLGSEHDVLSTLVHHQGKVGLRPLLIRRGYPGRWQGRIHEDLSFEGSWGLLDGSKVCSYNDGARAKRPDKHNQDLMLLFEEIAEHPNDPRWYYYLGATYMAAGDYEQAKKAFNIQLLYPEGSALERHEAQESLKFIGIMEKTCATSL